MMTPKADQTARDALFGKLGHNVLTILFFLVAIIYPWLVGLNPYYLEIGFNFWLWSLLALSLNVVLGGPGLYNLGQAAFFAVGAYTTALMNTLLGWPIFLLLPVSMLTAAIFGYIIARPIIHLRGDYLLIVTVGFAEIVRLALRNNMFGITGGANGILGIARPQLGPWTFTSNLDFYFLSLLYVLLAMWVWRQLEHSRVGRAWAYIREDELAAESVGVNTAAYKTLAFVVGASLAGAAGNLYATKMTVIAPESFSFWDSVVMFAIVILGGRGSIPGIFLGTFAMVVLPQLFRGLESYRMLVFGAAMVAMMIIRPQGLWPKDMRFRWRRPLTEGGEGR
ncbi:MAG: Branched-chain amino acid transport system permease protein LivM [Candidatus Carbobacillus altaicus]|uniref:Branched-chain amino acid transport system permease protein LivM n=1 Tax=Candidatus Carbonibacillus altaicus TaxID=2163959 RepID=A0A2R6XY81_9BACL|nr:MAG: Branched-chain amino acid transport system permease protein LivM [Candidatus Carbobacillus altaicus]